MRSSRTPEVEFVAIVLAQGIDAGNPRNVGLWDTVGRHGLDLAALGEIWLVCAAAHLFAAVASALNADIGK